MSTKNLNKKKTVIISIAAFALTVCIATAAILLTSRSSAEEIETTTEAETVSETETYTIKPIPHTTKKSEEPVEITGSVTIETQAPETVTFAPEPENGNVILNEKDAELLDELQGADVEFSLGEEIIETYEEAYTEPKEKTVTTTTAATAPVDTADWSGVVVDDGVLGGGWGDHLGQGGGGYFDDGDHEAMIAA